MTRTRTAPHRRTPAAALAAALAAVLTLGLLALGGCGNPVHLVTGGDQVQDYCAALHSDRREFARMVGENSPTALVTHLSMLHGLADKAPDDIADDWQVFVGAIEGLRHALASAGVDASDYHGGKPPPGLDPRHRRAIRDAADRLSADPVVRAAGTITQEATDVCKVNLGM